MGFLTDLPLSKSFSIAGNVKLSWKNGAYADAWFSLKEDTERISSFNAHGGFIEGEAACQLDYSITQKISVTLVG